jgi:threonylcarbamoyladenosine tRNA methylthiotransferase MtaB
MAGIAVFTLGCKVNQAESEELKMGLSQAGHGICQDPAAADVCVVNTCTVTAESDRKCRKLIRWLGKRGAGAIVVAGCYAEVSPGDLERLPGVIRILPNTRKDEWVEEIAALVEPGQVTQAASTPFRSRGFIKVQDGCERGCSYCIVPAARGKERSRSRDEVKAQTRRWLEKGVEEIVLCGVNLGRYGQDDGYDLASLVRDVLAIGGGFRIRLSSIELEDMRSEWVDEWAAQHRVCPHLHLPLQSGDDAILRDMGRGYDSDDYLKMVEEARSAWPRAALTTEVIVAYPGEGENAFERTADILREVRPSRLHVFRFSPRPGTRAWDKTGGVAAEEAERRSFVLRAMAEEWRTDYIESHRGERRGLLVERVIEGNGGRTVLGTTEDYIKGVLHEPPACALPGKVVDVCIRGLEGGRAGLKGV